MTDDPDVYVAVVADGARVRVYLCDGEDLGVWLQGTANGEAFTVEGADGSTGLGNIAAGVATGSVTTADGTTLTFTASQAGLPAGLYERTAVEDGQPVQARTIVLPDGSAKGKKKKFDCAANEKLYDIVHANYLNAPAGSAEREDWLDDQLAIAGSAARAGCAWAT